MNSQSNRLITLLLCASTLLLFTSCHGYRLNCEWACQRGLLRHACNCPAVREPKRSHHVIDEFDYDALFDSPADAAPLSGGTGNNRNHDNNNNNNAGDGLGSATSGQRGQQDGHDQSAAASRTSLFRWGKRSLPNSFQDRR